MERECCRVQFNLRTGAPSIFTERSTVGKLEGQYHRALSFMKLVVGWKGHSARLRQHLGFLEMDL